MEKVTVLEGNETVRAIGGSGIRLQRLPAFPDSRGVLSFGEFPRHVPFECRRYFLLYDIPKGESRGAHAHRECHQFLVCVAGSCQVRVDDGTEQAEVRLSSPTHGLYLPPMTWGVLHTFSGDAALMALASHPYDEKDYIRSYPEFILLKSKP